MMSPFIIPLIILTDLGLLFGIVLFMAFKRFNVYEDRRIDVVEEFLPSRDCGACGECV